MQLWPGHAPKAPKAVRRSGHRAPVPTTPGPTLHALLVTERKSLNARLSGAVADAPQPGRAPVAAVVQPAHCQAYRSICAPADNSHGAWCGALLAPIAKNFFDSRGTFVESLNWLRGAHRITTR